jgi:colanic acid biosynthesis glycosyl transferase WcaI
VALKILLVTLNYAPEPIGVGKYTGELAHWLAGHGHEVRVIAAPPYYPHWRMPTGSSRWRYRRERRGSVAVLRCPLWVPPRCSAIGRIALLSSFALTSFLPCLWQALRWRPDLVVAFEPTFLAAPAALLAARLSGAKACLHVQDCEIEAAFRFRLLRNSRLATALRSA